MMEAFWENAVFFDTKYKGVGYEVRHVSKDDPRIAKQIQKIDVC